ncbi:MAG: serine/threonine protein kinase [Victivallaceae bacterium]|nr:serine/threonine protein kinase [Victivallaceae bacterium]
MNTQKIEIDPQLAPRSDVENEFGGVPMNPGKDFARSHGFSRLISLGEFLRLGKNKLPVDRSMMPSSPPSEDGDGVPNPADIPLDLPLLSSRYELIQERFEGGQAKIWSAFDKVLRREIAVKALKTSREIACAGDCRAAFLNEAKITARLDHPTIVPLYGLYGERDEEEKLYLAMKFVRGRDLQRYVNFTSECFAGPNAQEFDAEKSLQVRLEYFVKICDGIFYAHSNEVIHCDLKLENIMIGDFGEVYIMDWGLARSLDSILPPPQKKLGAEEKLSITGTPGFIAPELLNGNPPDKRSDIFALGAILFELSTLQRAVPGQTTQEIIRNVAAGRFHRFAHRFKICPLPRDLEAIFRRACAKNPDQRYQSAKTLADDVRRCMAGEETLAYPDNPPRKLLRFVGRHRGVALGIIAALLFYCFAAVTAGAIQLARQTNYARLREKIMISYQGRVEDVAQRLDRIFLTCSLQLSAFADQLGLLLSHAPDSAVKDTFLDKPRVKAAAGTFRMSTGYNKYLNERHGFFHCAPGVKKTLAAEERRLLRPLDQLLAEMIAETDPDRTFTTMRQKLAAVFNCDLPVTWFGFGSTAGYYLMFPAHGDLEKDYDPRTRQWYLDGMRSRRTPVWGKPYQCASGIGTVISCSRQVIDSRGRFRGVAEVDVSMRYLFTQVLAKTSTRADYQYIIESDGMVVALRDNTGENAVLQTQPKRILLDEEIRNSLTKLVGNSTGGQLRITERGKDYLYSFSQIRTTGFYYVEKIQAFKLLPDSQ